MDKKYICYCGLYCKNCAVKAKIEPAAKNLYEEMKKAGFEEVISSIPGGDGFWPFLRGMADEGVCISCRDGSGDPGCAVRICAKEKGVVTCALCGDYPCDKLADLFEGYPMLKNDNELLRKERYAAWAALQNERRARGFTYSDEGLNSSNK